jgi:hypothetical protein
LPLTSASGKPLKNKANADHADDADDFPYSSEDGDLEDLEFDA